MANIARNAQKRNISSGGVQAALDVIKAEEQGDREQEARVLLRGQRKGAKASRAGHKLANTDGFQAVRSAVFRMLDVQLSYLKTLRDQPDSPDVWDENDADIATLVTHAHQQLKEFMSRSRSTVDELNVDLGTLASLISVAKRSYSRQHKAYWYQLSYTNAALMVSIEMLELADGSVQ